MSNYNSIQEVFDLLNKSGVEYLVLRNYENILSPEMYVNGHGDVDLLCADSRVLAKVINAEAKVNDETHYYIYVAGEQVSLDLRHIGDDYYCMKWEEELLKRKVKQECFYVMNQQDYFYTLIYHAILQKAQLSAEYQQRLTQMAQTLNILLAGNTEIHFINILQQYMKKNGYVFVYPVDSCVPARFRLVNRDMIKTNWHNYWNHLVFHTRVKIIEILVKIKHAIYK